MYQMRYADIMEEDVVSGREREEILFERCISMLEEARKQGAGSAEAKETASFMDEFWLVLTEDLGRPDNALPNDLKASLISIGIYVMKETVNMRNGSATDFDNLIMISKSLRDGLAPRSA